MERRAAILLLNNDLNLYSLWLRFTKITQPIDLYIKI